MRIGISARGLYQGSFAISTIIYHLSNAIIELASNDIEIVLYFNNPGYEYLFHTGIRKRSIKLNNRLIWDHAWLPYVLKRDMIDMALFFKGTIPVMLPCKGAVIFHDMGYFHDELHPYKPIETIYMRKMIARAGRRASKIFAVSEYTKNETRQILGIDPEKICVVHPSCSAIFKLPIDIETKNQVVTSYGLPKDYIFCPTSISPRKNFSRILDAFSRIRDRIPHHLVITGGQTWQTRHLLKRIKSEFRHRIHVLGNVPQAHLPALYTLAKFTIYPSLLEGFGFPILESFHSGCPVLTSNITGMPEVAGGAAYLVDPFSVEQISAGMYALATDEALRQDLIKKGFERTKFFSWHKAAFEVLKELEKG